MGQAADTRRVPEAGEMAQDLLRGAARQQRAQPLLLVYVIARHDYTKSGATKGSKRAAEALRAEAQNTRMEQIKVPFGRG